MRCVLALVLAGCSFHHGHVQPVQDDAPLDAPADAVDAPPDAPPPPFAMAGLRWLLPCTTGDLGNYNCNCVTGAQTQMATIAGTGKWNVTVRVRGVMEAIGYNGGTAGDGGWYAGGTPADINDNYYELVVSQPAQHFYLNRGTPTAQQSFVYDEMATFEVDGGATIMFVANGQDGLQWGNYGPGPSHTPWTIAGVSTTPSPYDGQFAQLDVVSAAAM